MRREWWQAPPRASGERSSVASPVERQNNPHARTMAEDSGLVLNNWTGMMWDSDSGVVKDR